MFICDDLIYIQMQKTGCTHIACLLSKLFDGESTKIKHNAASPEQLNSGRYFISSIRNPWEWYLSLWTFGVQGRGGFMNRLTRLTEEPAIWRSVYDKSDNIESFRKWLVMVHDPENSKYLGESYGDTAITRLCGFMTYRYLKLCTRNINRLKENGLISTYEELARFDIENCYIDYFIRQEALEDTLCKAIEPLRTLSQKERKLIFESEKTNTSVRTLSISDYYDQESIELIRTRDRLVIDKFDYPPPHIA